MRGRELHIAKIRELREVVVAAGYLHLGEQAAVLGLSRSTTWTILRAKHKNTGLSASVINRMLAQPRLPGSARVKISEYVAQKSAGTYGHNSRQVRRFLAQLQMPDHTPDVHRQICRPVSEPKVSLP